MRDDRCRGSACNLRLASIVLACALAVACGGQPDPNLAPDLEPVVGRDADGEIVIRFSGAPPGARYSVYLGRQPAAIDRSRAVAELSSDTPGHGVSLPGIAHATRPYFELVDQASGSSRIVAERLLPLEGTHNFRDLGGYATADGRRVRWGLLYRADHLADLSDADLAYLRNLGIRLVCDFRGPREREADPDRLPAVDPPEVALLEIADESFDPDALRQRILGGDANGDDLDQILLVGNRKFATEYRDRYAALFARLLAADGLPALIHCTAGKDRTGFGAALILRALGVPEETIFDDFLLSNRYSAEHIESSLRMIRLASLFRTDTEVVRPLLSVRRAYLEAAFDAIDEQYGGFDRYLRNELDMDDAEQAALERALLD